MRYVCLACDFDGTLASGGVVLDEAIAALSRVKESGRNLILATGRRLEDLFEVFPQVNMFDYLVCENGALLYNPATKVARALVEPPPRAFIEALKKRGVEPLAVGRVVVASWHPNEAAILETIQAMGLDLHISFNKGAVMVLPAGVNKGTGVRAALSELGLSVHNLVSVGDAENDHALLSISECAATVANALPIVKERADLTLSKDHGAGVVELIEHLLSSDLSDWERLMERHNVLLGTNSSNGQGDVTFKTYDYRVLIAGPSLSGKSTVSMSILEQLASAGYQYCVVDPEGEYDRGPHAVTVGNEHYTPEIDDVMRVLENPDDNVVVNLLGVSLGERPRFLARIFAAIHNLRRLKGRPHWLVIDEAHHMLHPYWDQTFESIWHDPGALVIITVDPAEISKKVLAGIDMIVAVGQDPGHTISKFAERIGHKLPSIEQTSLGWGEALVWFKHEYGAPFKVTMLASPLEWQRHLRKYSEGNVGPQRSFYFTGPAGRMNIKCQNLFLFMQVGEGIDDDTWLYHLRRGDYSSWFRDVIRDQTLAEGTAQIEQNVELSASESRDGIRELIAQRYTLPVNLFG
jgi:HAD superfamily hydrolase (TIGR01484 family)